MRRYQYRLNDQNIAANLWGHLQPLKYMETVPGDTFGGTVTVKARSGLIPKVIHSRAYYDLYAFYCPIRLLWDKFPVMLAGHEGDVSIPVTSNLFPQNFESSFVGDDGSASDPIQGPGVNAAFLRRMYHMIYHSFFAVDRADDARRAQDNVNKIRNGDFDLNNTSQRCLSRESTFDESWNNYDEDEGVQIATDAEGNFTLDQVRRAYSLDRFEKMRDFYGSRYTDLLKSYGVKADWGVLQEPEVIGISNNDFRFVKKSNTGDQFGAERGYFEGEYKVKLRKTFCPEHGIIGIFAVPRADIFNQTHGGHILNTRQLASPTAWYDKVGWSGYNSQSFPKRLLDTGAPRGDRAETALGEHLRKGRNEIAIPAGMDWDNLPVFSRSMSGALNPVMWRKNACSPDPVESRDVSAADLPEERTDPGNNMVSHYAECRITKRSPVQPAAITTMR